MKIYLELLIIFIALGIFILWYLWNGWSRKRLLKKYDPKKDLAKLGEDKRIKEIKEGLLILQNEKTRKGGEENANNERATGTESSPRTAVESSTGLTEPEGRELLPTTKAVDDGKSSSSNRKNGLGIRKLLSRRRRK